jgi:hypothetical protein
MNTKTLLTSEEFTANQPTQHPVVANPIGLPVRTNLRAGLAWDDLDDKAQELWSSLTNAVSGAVSGFGESA